MNRAVILFLMMLGLPMAIGGCTGPTDLETAETLLSRGDYQQAILLCDTFLLQDPHNVEWLTKKARTYIEMKEYAVAEEILLRAVECEPSNSEPHYELERLYFRVNNDDKARFHGDLAVRLDPRNILRFSEAPRMETSANSKKEGSPELLTGLDASSGQNASSWSQDRESVESSGFAGLPDGKGVIGREASRGSADVPGPIRSTTPSNLSQSRHKKGGRKPKEGPRLPARFSSGENDTVQPDTHVRRDARVSRRRQNIDQVPTSGSLPTPSYFPSYRPSFDSDPPQTTSVPGWQNGAFSLSAPSTATPLQLDPKGVRWHSAGGVGTAWQRSSDAGIAPSALPSLTSSPTPSLLEFKRYNADPSLQIRTPPPPGNQRSNAAPRSGPLRLGVRTQMGPLPTTASGNPLGISKGNASLSPGSATGR